VIKKLVDKNVKTTKYDATVLNRKMSENMPLSKSMFGITHNGFKFLNLVK
jgi:hypothetical protein